MMSNDLNQILFNDPYAKKFFCGVFASDELAKWKPPKRKMYGLIVNTDNYNQSGRHWQSIFVIGKTAFFFCSFAEKPNKAISKFLAKYPRVIKNKIKHQNNLAITCGGYCVFLQAMMSRGIRFTTLCDIFKNMENDDLFISNYLRETYNFFI